MYFFLKFELSYVIELYFTLNIYKTESINTDYKLYRIIKCNFVESP